jgi:uncharacterized protein (UPF0332 family)
MFYEVLALLHTKNLSSSKHTGVRALFNEHFVKAGIVPKEREVVRKKNFLNLDLGCG